MVLDEDTAARIGALERQVAELREAVAARDAFLAMAAHELRNPMTPILAHVQRLRRLIEAAGHSRNAPSRDDLAAGLARLERLVEGYVRRATTLLEVSRMTTGKRSLVRERFDLAELLRDVAEAAAPAAQYAGSRIALDTPERFEIQGDRLAMEQILDNLVSNAVKYGLGRPIDLALHAAADGAVVTVRDRGIGISAADQSRIFGQFERAVSQGASAGGFGVGLWVVGQLVDAMGARIEVTSSPGEGTTMTLRLPQNETDIT
ncbi:sensor histidine kinase [Microvirga thermotolerans]|uniref:histidine kinase n=1 Tax=Microvirga thermotolerans TaxID=2651334 RepID=A0A5P9JYU0_9HYPH|nr:HAMP domain-containing sensor histidine kinase [Microvirga thermotolerans]QFU17603.1 sensor histidine kinase [Microvirga thermotolerans]